MLKWIRPIFLAAAVGDLALGAAFLLEWERIFRWLSITPVPAPAALLEFCAATGAIFGVGYFFVAVDPWRNLDLIKLGVAYKLAFVAIVIHHWQSTHAAPHWVFLVLAVLDAALAVLFIMSLWTLKRAAKAAGAA